MFKDVRIAIRIIILLIIIGLTYLIYPRMASLAEPWLQAPTSSTAAGVISPADTPPAPAELVTMTGTSTPEKLVAAATPVTTAAATATMLGTATLAPLIEETPFNPNPAAQATADYLDALATADASLNSPATPAQPTGGVATPLIPTTTATPQPQPTSLALVVVTETPTPQNIITAAAEAAKATAVATAIGTYTPMPWNWVVPIVITPEPATAIPANAATASFQVAAATASAFVNGTPTPWPVNVWTATPTPFMRPVVGEVATPWIPPSPTPMPIPIPQGLIGKIMFLSNRSGGPLPLPEPLVYVVNPDGSNLAVLNDDTFYRIAQARDKYSADQRYRAFIQDIERYDRSGPIGPEPGIFFFDYQYNGVQQITSFGLGGAWDPAWSPTQEQIVFVSDESAQAEVWLANRDGSGVRQLTASQAAVASELGKNNYIPDDAHGHPSWSPDGSKIVYWSSLGGHRQIWVINADGSNAYTLSTTGHDDWDPVWIKYTDLPRDPVVGIGAGSNSETPSTDAQSKP